jgi:DNA-binding protein HU-beta
MNKSELIDAVATSSDLPKAQAARAVDAMIDVISSALKGGDQVTIVGFGTFLVREREARSGRNPRTGETILQGWQRPQGCSKLARLPSGA